MLSHQTMESVALALLNSTIMADTDRLKRLVWANLRPTHLGPQGHLQNLYRAVLQAYSGNEYTESEVFRCMDPNSRQVYLNYLGKNRARIQSHDWDPDVLVQQVIHEWMMNHARMGWESLGALRGADSSKVAEQLRAIGNAMVDAANLGYHEEYRAGDLMLQQFAKRPGLAWSTGCNLFDYLFGGGYQANALYVIGMPSGKGKTSVTIHLACAAVRAERPIVVVQAETSLYLMTQRMLANLTGIPVFRFDPIGNNTWREVIERKDFAVLHTKGYMSDEEVEAIAVSYSAMNKYTFLHEPGDGIPDIEEYVVRHGMESGHSPDVLYDHIAYHLNGDDAAFALKRETDALYRVSGRYNNCIVANSQVNDPTAKSLTSTNYPGTNPQYKYSNGIYNGAFQAIFGTIHNGHTPDGNLDPWLVRHHTTIFHRHKNRGRGGAGIAIMGYDLDRYRYYPLPEQRLATHVETDGDTEARRADSEFVPHMQTEILHT